jgi:hypothetical protein
MGVALLATAGMVSASPASAATTNTVTLVFKNGTSHAYPCDGGSTFHTDLPNYVTTLNNNCTVRVWLHTNNNNTGYSACASGKHDFKVDDTIKFVNLYVSTNTALCDLG